MSHRHFRWLLALVIACACSTPADRFVDPNNAPVYLYCDHGRDRTGYIVARYRLRLHGWTGDQIERELDRYGHGRLMRWYMPG